MSTEHTATRTSIQSAGVMMVFALSFTALLALTYQATRPAILASQEAEKMKLVEAVLPSGHYDNDLLAHFYDDWANRLAAMPGEVVVLCEGDPFFYGSFMHLHSRLQGRVPVEVIPGITGMTGCWHATETPITWGDDVLTVLMGTLPEEDLVRHMSNADALVVMGAGKGGTAGACLDR